MTRFLFRAAALAAFLASVPLSDAFAHCFVGGRFFPATLVGDDPCVADELSLPTVAWFKTGDIPANRETDISGEFSKRITDTLGVSFGETWTHLKVPGGPNANGFQNLETTLKWQFFTDAMHELVMSVGVSVEWGGTGALQVGADPFSTITPTFFFGKGFGDLPDSVRFLRPFGITGQVGYAVPSSGTKLVPLVDPDTGDVTGVLDHRAQFLVYAGSIQYSMPYLKSSVVDLGLPDFINHLIPIVEAQFSTPVLNTIDTGTVTTGTVNPGVLWVGSYFQVGVEAIIPINRASGTGVGVIGQLHLYLDDIFPRSIGRPLFASNTYTPGRPMFGN